MNKYQGGIILNAYFNTVNTPFQLEDVVALFEQPDFVDEIGDSLIHSFLASRQSETQVEKEEEIKIIKFLIENGVSPISPNSRGQTPLMYIYDWGIKACGMTNLLLQYYNQQHINLVNQDG